MKKETKRLILAGLFVFLGSGATHATDYTAAIGAGNYTDDIFNMNVKNVGYLIDASYPIGASESKDISITGKEIYIKSTADKNMQLVGADSWSNATLSLGSDKTESITVDVQNPNIAYKNNGEPENWVYGIVSIGKNNPSKPLTEVNVTAKKLYVNTIGSTDYQRVAALFANNSTDGVTAPQNAAQLNINAQEIELNSSSIGIGAFSNGQVNINGNLTVNAKNALDVRGHSTTNINTDGKHSTVLNGDIVFETPWTPEDGAGSGRVIDANVNVYLKGKDSSWTGSAYQEYKNHKSDTEWQHVTDMTTNADNDDTPGNVTGFKLTMADGASWNMTGDSFVNDVKASGDSTIHVGSNVKTANMQNVTLDKATIDLAGDHQTVNVTDTLSGNGTIATNSLNNKLTAADAADADITVKGSGDIADQIAGDSQVAQKLADVAANQDGRSIAKSVKTDAGVIAGEYSAQVDENGKVFNEVKSQNQTNLSISKLGALSLMTWRQENNDMNKRLGEIRDSQGEQGIWARMSRGEAKYSATGVKNQYNYYQLGYDHKIADDWILGGAFTYTDGENNLVGGSGTNKNTGFAVYGSNLRDDGSFIDLIAKYAHMKNDFDTIGGVGIGEYSTNGYALSAEYGKRFQQDGFWIEPQAELTYGKVSSADFTTSEGAKVHQDSLDSLVGRLGFSLGKDVKAGNVYVRASYLYDFKGDVAMRMSNGVASATYDQDLGGSWWEFGVGTNLNFGKDMHFYFDVERTEGGKVDTPWQWNAGVRLSF